MADTLTTLHDLLKLSSQSNQVSIVLHDDLQLRPVTLPQGSPTQSSMSPSRFSILPCSYSVDNCFHLASQVTLRNFGFIGLNILYYLLPLPLICSFLFGFYIFMWHRLSEVPDIDKNLNNSKYVILKETLVLSPSGIFTAPCDGLYSFSFTVYSKLAGPDDKMYYKVQLMRNGEVMASTWEDNKEDSEDSSSQSIVLQLKRGGQVYVELWTGRQLCGDSWGRNTFSGSLIYPSLAE